MKKNKLFLFYWVPFLLCAFFVIYFSVRPSIKIMERTFFSFPHSDKIKHFLAYSFLTFFSFRCLKAIKWEKLFFPISVGISFLGIFLEILQAFIGRTFEYADIIVNTLGVVFIYFLWCIFISKNNLK